MTKLKELIEQYSYQNEGVYTLIDIENLCREYVKICLEKAANEAMVCCWYVDNEGEEQKLEGQNIYGDDYKYKIEFDCLPTFQIDKQSITNIELP